MNDSKQAQAALDAAEGSGALFYAKGYAARDGELRALLSYCRAASGAREPHGAAYADVADRLAKILDEAS